MPPLHPTARRAPLLAALTLLCTLWCAAAVAQPVELTREAAMQMAAERNYDLMVQTLEQERQSLLVETTARPYIPRLYANASYLDDAPFNADLSRRRALGYGGGVRWSTTVGTEVDVSVREDDTLTGAARAGTNVSAGVSVAQPLLRGAGTEGAAPEVLQADLDAQLGVERFRATLNAFLVEVEQAYWDLAFRQADVQIKNRSVKRARGQYEDTRENIKRGLLAESDVYIVEENLVFFQQQLIQSQANLKLARQELARLLQLEPDAELVAADDLDKPAGALPSTKEALERGLRANPTLAARRLSVERAEIDLAFEDNRLLPTLDVSGTFRLNGLGASPAPAWQSAVGGDRPEWRVGLNFEIPLDRDPDRARVRRASLSREQAVVDLKAAEQRITYDVNARLIELGAQLERFELAERQQDLSALKLTAEQDKYKSGIAILANVIRFQRDLDQSNLDVARVVVNLWVARARLLATQGNLHQSVGIEVK